MGVRFPLLDPTHKGKTMTPRERLQNVQERLKSRGVKDVKFTWSEDVKNMTPDQVYDQVSTALEAYLDGHCTRASCYDNPDMQEEVLKALEAFLDKGTPLVFNDSKRKT